MAPALGLIFRIEPKMNQRVMTLAGFHNDVAPIATVATRRAASRNKLLPAESEASIPAIPSLYSNCGFIDKHLPV